MDRNKLITHILNNISELQSLTKGMESMADVPQFLHSLALEKVDNLKRAFLDLSVAKEVVESEPHQIEKVVYSEPEVVISIQTEEEHVEEWQSALSDLKDEEEELQIVVPQDEEPETVSVKEETREAVVREEPKAVVVELPKQDDVASKEQEIVAKPTSSVVPNDRFKTSIRGLGGVRSAEGRFVKDLKRALNLNDRIRYKKELFHGDKELMDSTIDRLDVCLSLNEALQYVSQFGWDDENEAVADFIALLERRFSK
ncbi:MAG: hypothetical protein MJZ19_02960 [Paludibacteraceae bacterium]|nr:hypothetical protein [Paludibacteraceae bacterium]